MPESGPQTLSGIPSLQPLIDSYQDQTMPPESDGTYPLDKTKLWIEGKSQKDLKEQQAFINDIIRRHHEGGETFSTDGTTGTLYLGGQPVN